MLEPLPIRMAFHHPDLAEAADLVAAWAETCGLDAERGRALTMGSIVDPVDWVADLEQAIDAGAGWVLDLGPGDLAARLSLARAARSAAPPSSRRRPAAAIAS